MRLAFAALLICFSASPSLCAQAKTAAALDTIRMQVQWKISSQESRTGEELGVLSSVAIDSLGTVYVADFSAAAIRVFSAKGEAMRSVGRKGEGPGEFNSPAGLGIGPDGMLYVRDLVRYTRFRRDPVTKRLTAYDATIPRQAMSDWTTKSPVKFANASTFFDPNFASFSRPPKFSGRYYRYSTAGKLVDSIMVPLFANSPAPMASWRVSAGSGRLAPGLNHVPFAAIPVWDLTSAGTLLSGNGDEYLLAERDAAGNVLNSYRRSVSAQQISARERADSTAALKRRIDTLPVPVSRLEGVPPNVIKLDLPRVFPFYSAVFSASDGKVWVRRWVNGGDKRTVFDVFERDGKFLSTVALPVVISSEVQPVLRLDRIVAVVVDPDTGENMVYAFTASGHK